MYRNRPCVVIGRNQNPWKEADVPYAKNNDIWLVRRISGGGTVYHDLGNTNYSIIMPRASFDRNTNALLVSNALNSLKISTIVNQRHDITIDDYKVSGSAFKIIGKKAFHHGTMLLNTDTLYLRDCLRSKMNITEAKGVDSVPSKVTNLSKYMQNIDHQMFIDAVSHKFQAKYGRFKSIINFDQNSDIDFILKNRATTDGDVIPQSTIFTPPDTLSSWEWIFGQTPDFSFSTEGEIQNIKMVFIISTLKGHISKISIHSPTFDGQNLLCSLNLIDLLNAQLCGVKLKRSTLQAKSKKVFFNPALSKAISIICCSI
ncbi:hypothetical protein BB561_003805 [Smittium simulii]|uniref:Putative lipoate-protein ligase A n=1 Tax=Smittium simulii TaxID=133385 RepID=A0A2T9YJJ8_9FUNG|nr:hypothetical protein BB561_003805 [Smittium simulii]